MKRWRVVLPWLISGALLFYVFGYATEWSRLLEAMSQADTPRFLFYATADRIAFFVIWTWLSAIAVRRFVAPVPFTSVFAIRGGSELARAVNNPLSDAAYLIGLVQLVGGRVEAVLSSALVPVVTHLLVMLVQMTIAMPFQEGGFAAVPGVTIATVALWGVVGIATAAIGLAGSGRLRWGWVVGVQTWLSRFHWRQFSVFFWGFAALAIFDIHIQWLASRAFGVDIDWMALAARLPLIYLAFLIPTLGNFGTRELTWAALFDEFGARDELIAYAFSINAIFLVLNVVLGVLFLQKALALIGAVRAARREGGKLPRPFLGDPVDP